MGRAEILTTEAELSQSRQRAKAMSVLLSVLGSVFIGALMIPASYLGFRVGQGWTRELYSAGFAVLLGVPMIVVSTIATKKQSVAVETVMDELRTELTAALEDAESEATKREAQARRQEFESRLTNALEMAASETEVIDVVERAFVATVGDSPAELLLADNSHAHLTRMAASPSAADETLCHVESPDQCPAARRAQVQRFSDSEALDACPKLRAREQGQCSAVCVPVSIMGRTVGVIHVTGRPNEVPEAAAVQDLATLANQAGARVGLLRMMADTQLQAATDSLTGLLNRRAFENEVRLARTDGAGMAVVMADLDHFKHLNDTYGHDTGDRALRLFAETLRASVRAEDLVCRYGGEEFAIVLPSCGATAAAAIARSVGTAVARATAEAGLPKVTASFGVVEADGHEDLARAVGRADAALLEAKRAGRDRVVVHGVTVEDVPSPRAEDDEISRMRTA